jgi:hypothetical protein
MADELRNVSLHELLELHAVRARKRQQEGRLR